MTLTAILIALIANRVFSSLEHHREPRWFLYWAHFLQKLKLPANLITVIITVAFPAALIYFIGKAIPDHTWLGMMWMLFSAFVLWMCLGPKDLYRLLADYLQARRQHDDQRAKVLAEDILDQPLKTQNKKVISALDQKIVERVLVAANDRYFAVVFWFMLFSIMGAGPAGAMLFRGSEYLAVHPEVENQMLRRPAGYLHDALAWLPARLLAMIYPLLGNFYTGLRAWQTHLERPVQPGENYANRVLLLVGKGAIAINEETVPDRSIDKNTDEKHAQSTSAYTLDAVENSTRLTFYSLFFSLGLLSVFIAAGYLW